MKALLSTVCAATIALGAIAPLHAAPLMVPQAASPAPAEIIEIQNRSTMEFGDRGWRGKRWDRGGRHWDRRDWKRHRNWRHRHRYRDRDGDDLAIGLGAFAAGALLGGALNSGPRRVYRGGNAHVDWCYDRYRSYRASDNTFQPYNGPRKQCYSPYS